MIIPIYTPTTNVRGPVAPYEEGNIRHLGCQHKDSRPHPLKAKELYRKHMEQVNIHIWLLRP